MGPTIRLLCFLVLSILVFIPALFMKHFLSVPIFLLFFFSCTSENEQAELKLFSRLSPAHTGIAFSNDLLLKEGFDVFRYRNYYNGGGVAIGDINNDGLPDIYLTANMKTNKLFLNKGDFRFEDITEKAGVGGNKVWSTGVSMADVNGDGLLDIYVCNSGDVKGGQRENELYINNGDLTFSEQAAAYGLADKGFSTHAVFFDYDQDGDLDCYILNNSFRPVSSLGYENIRDQRDSTGGDKLFRNDLILDSLQQTASSNSARPQFTDVSTEAGIFGSVIGFGLGVTITDVNLDTWPDMYVSNDFFERDYLYINQKDGTFTEELPKRIGHTSHFAMGTDAADINNDGYPDIYVTDMLPNDDYRLKTTTSFESFDIYQTKLANDYYEQYMRNTLQLNRGDGTFLEIGQYAGIDATDWSWGALIADFDNDAQKEIYVTNGIYKDLTDQDFIAFLANEENLIAAMRQEKVDFQNLVDKMPSNKLSNYMFKKNDNLTFNNVAAAWGLDELSFSNGAAYGDLDNDGDLDVVVNNVNQEVFVYRNNADNLKNKHYLKISFRGPLKNTYGVGASVNAYFNGKNIMLENMPTKGFQSSMDAALTMGLDTISVLDSLVVHWGYQKKQTLLNVATNQHLVLNIEDARIFDHDAAVVEKTIFTPVTIALDPPYKHKEDSFIDFHRESLIYHMISREGPALAVADINNDGLDDFFVGSASGSLGALYIQNQNGGFSAIDQRTFEAAKMQEDVDALFFDADNDGDQDLYVVSGGNTFRENAREYADRLYLLKEFKNGRPVYELASDALPNLNKMGACVEAADYDNDGDLDLFIGTRGVPGRYGMSAASHLLQNNGQGKFTDVTSRVAPQMGSLGMVTDAVWLDYDTDGDLDLAVVGEWMSVVLFKNNGTNLERLNNVPGLEKSEGWWNSVAAADINNDGHMDLVAGNWGTNSRFKTSKEKPFTLYVDDFDKNGITEHIFTYYEGEKQYPMALKDDLIKQIPGLKKKFIYYKDYAGKTVDEVFSKEQLSNAYVHQIFTLESAAIINNGDGSYQMQPLPETLQFSPINAIISSDFNHDSIPEIFMAGNFSAIKPEEGRYDANHGHLMKFNDDDILLESFKKSGLNIKGDVREAAILKTINHQKLLIIAKNNDELEFYKISSSITEIPIEHSLSSNSGKVTKRNLKSVR